MKYVLRVLVFALLAALTIGTAAYRMDPEVSPEMADNASLSEHLSGSFSDILQEAAQSLREGVSDVGSAAADTAAGTAMSLVTNVEHTGTYTQSGQELLDVSLSSSAVPLICKALSNQTGGMVTTEELVSQLNQNDNVKASQNEDGSVSVEVPEDLYDQYKDQLSAAISGG